VPIWVPQCAGTIVRGPGGFSGGGWVTGRLRPGVTLGQARARLAALTPDMVAATHSSSTMRLTVEPFARGITSFSPSFGQALFGLMTLVAVVLLIACANIATLLLARATARRREVAIRLALGASRARLARQFLIESLILSSAGAGLGLLAARWCCTVLLGLV